MKKLVISTALIAFLGVTGFVVASSHSEKKPAASTYVAPTVSISPASPTPTPTQTVHTVYSVTPQPTQSTYQCKSYWNGAMYAVNSEADCIAMHNKEAADFQDWEANDNPLSKPAPVDQSNQTANQFSQQAQQIVSDSQSYQIGDTPQINPQDYGNVQPTYTPPTPTPTPNNIDWVLNK
jgi:hypothetical protein